MLIQQVMWFGDGLEVESVGVRGTPFSVGFVVHQSAFEMNSWNQGEKFVAAIIGQEFCDCESVHFRECLHAEANHSCLECAALPH